MRFQLDRPEAVLKAQQQQKGLNWFLEIVMFLLLFLAGTIVQVLFMVPGEMLLMSQNAAYQAAAAAGDMEGVNAALLQLAGSDAYTVLSLFSTVAMTAVTLLFCRFLQKRTPDTLGFTKKGGGKEYLIGLGIGFGMFSAAVLLCIATGALKIEGFSPAFGSGMFLLFFAGFMIQGMGEEALCRGCIMVSIGRRYPMWIAVFSNAVLFASLHLLNNGISTLAFCNLILFGVFASLYFIKRGNIWGICALHGIWNLAQGNFWGIRVSGIVTECSVFRSTPTEEKAFMNGGAFGLEGGFAVTLVLLAGICFLLCKKPAAQKTA